MTDDPGRDAGRGPMVRRGVAAAVLAESIVVVVYGFVLAIDTLVAKPVSMTASASLALLVVLLGVGVGVVGVAVWQGRRWSRAPALVWQFLQLAATLPALGSDREVATGYQALTGVLVAVAVLVVVGLFVPGVIDEDVDHGTGPREG